LVGNLQLCEDALNLGLQRWQIFYCGEPDSTNVYAKVVVDQLVAHAGDILPGNMGVSGAQFLWKMPGGLTDDFDLTDHTILDQRVLLKGGLIDALQVGFRPGDGI
jgi:hypothetical protein